MRPERSPLRLNGIIKDVLYRIEREYACLALPVSGTVMLIPVTWILLSDGRLCAEELRRNGRPGRNRLSYRCHELSLVGPNLGLNTRRCRQHLHCLDWRIHFSSR